MDPSSASGAVVSPGSGAVVDVVDIGASLPVSLPVIDALDAVVPVASEGEATPGPHPTSNAPTSARLMASPCMRR